MSPLPRRKASEARAARAAPRLRLWFAQLCWLLAFCTAANAADRQAFVALGASVLKIEVLRIQGGYSLGSGVVVAPGKVVTNCHVTRDGGEIHVLRGGARWRVESQASDVEHDLCVLHVPRMKGESVKLGRAAELKIGQPVVALGYTGGLGLQSSAGDVVALHKLDGSSVIQSTNWFNSGASGGGLFDEELRLVGILTFRLRGGAAHYFAAPIDWVQRLLDDDSNFRAVTPLAAQTLSFWQRPAAEQPGFMRAGVLQRERRWPELEAVARQWTQDDAEDAEAWYLLGVSLDGLDKRPEARRALERSARLEPAFADVWLRLGLAALRDDDAAGARDALARLRALRSDLSADLERAIAAR